MDKTVVVSIERTKVHPLYEKRYQVDERIKVHDPQNECEIGERILIEPTRPISKEKSFKLVKKLS